MQKLFIILLYTIFIQANDTYESAQQQVSNINTRLQQVSKFIDFEQDTYFHNQIILVMQYVESNKTDLNPIILNLYLKTLKENILLLESRAQPIPADLALIPDNLKLSY